jgi:cytochrome c oxidase subunit 4
MEQVNTTHASVKTYLLVFLALAVLTGGTVLLSYAGFSHNTAVVLAILIATTKCTLIGAFFMHLKWESKGIYALLFTALFFVAVLILAVIPDIGIIQ